MNIKYNVKSYATESKPLRVVITHKGKVYKKSVGISVATWDNKKQKCGHIPTDAKLRLIRIGLESMLDEFSDEKAIFRALERVEGGEWHDDAPARPSKPNTPSFDEFFREWSERATGARPQTRLTYRIVTEEMGHTDWTDFDSAYYVRLIKAFDRRGMRPNYQGVVLGRLKTCLNEAYALHYIDNCDFREWEKPSEETFAIALNQSEVDRLWNADLEGAMAHTRDLAIVGIYTAARFSDYSRLTSDNVVDGRISFIQEKTGQPVLIPCSPKVKEVLERNKGRVPKMCSQVFNRDLKLLCKELNIDTVVQVPDGIRKRLKKKKGEKVYKWELVSSHTCRRTGASLLYKSGVPIRVCRYLTGHTKDETFLKYIKIDIEEGAEMLAKNEFFK